VGLWIGLYQEFLKLFSLPLQFDKLVGDCVEYVGTLDKTRVCSSGSFSHGQYVQQHHEIWEA
jgi:hypothetical protein